MASFMVFREPHVWRFSHARHHTDTDVVGRDPEIDARPLDMWSLGLAFFNVQGIRAESAKLWMHARGRMSAAERARHALRLTPDMWRTRNAFAFLMSRAEARRAAARVVERAHGHATLDSTLAPRSGQRPVGVVPPRPKE